MPKGEFQDLEPICEPARPVDRRVSIGIALVAMGAIALFVGLFLVVPRAEPVQASPQADCARAAPQGCVRDTIEVSYERGFRGYHYCACAMANGEARGFLAADSSVYAVDDKLPRAAQEPHPAVTFPVGVPHR